MTGLFSLFFYAKKNYLFSKFSLIFFSVVYNLQYCAHASYSNYVIQGFLILQNIIAYQSGTSKHLCSKTIKRAKWHFFKPSPKLRFRWVIFLLIQLDDWLFPESKMYTCVSRSRKLRFWEGRYILFPLIILFFNEVSIALWHHTYRAPKYHISVCFYFGC